MTWHDGILALGGFGIFLFSLRFLTAVLERSLARRFKSLLEWLFATPLSGILYGILTTMIVGASSITIIAAMGLVATALIPLEQAYFLMLGATIGTTVKAWFFALSLEQFGPGIIGVSSVAMIFVRKPLARELLEVLLAIGFTFFGLDLLANGLEPLTRLPWFEAMIHQFQGTSLAQECLGVLIGAALTMGIQSSSAMLLLTMRLASEGHLDFQSGACLILGANIGTTITASLACLEYDAAVRRLAVGHVLVKTIGVGIILFLFPSFLKVVNIIVPGEAVGEQVKWHLAGVHTVFNVINVCIFSLLANPMLRFLSWLIPERSDPTSLALPAVVRRMLVRTPDRALQEAERQLGVMIQQTKALIDYCLSLLQQSLEQQELKVNPTRFGRDFTDLKESLHDLLLRLSRREVGNQQQTTIRQQLHLLAQCEGLHHQGMALRSHLRSGLLEQHNALPEEFAPLVASYQKNFDTLWLRVHFRCEPSTEEIQCLLGSVEQLEQDYFSHVVGEKGLTQMQLSWMYDVVSSLRQLAMVTIALASRPMESLSFSTDLAETVEMERPAASAS